MWLKKFKNIKNEIDVWIEDFFYRFPDYYTEKYHYILFPGGKRIRPILTLLSAKSIDRKNYKKVLPLASAIEIMHNFTLVHDDLPMMDNDRERRGKPTLHVKYSEHTALLVGDGMIIKSLQALNELDLTKDHFKKLLNKFYSTLICIIEGQGIEMDMRKKNATIGKKDIRTIVKKKTACLFAFSMWAGVFAVNPYFKYLKDIYDIGMFIGMAFQIKDDLMDRKSNEFGYHLLYGEKKAEKIMKKYTDYIVNKLKNLSDEWQWILTLKDFLLTRTL